MDLYKVAARGYDELYGQEQKLKLKIVKQNLSVKTDHLLLDVGCGTGLSSQFDCAVVGIDPEFALLKQNNRGFLVQAAAESIPFKNNCFDIVLSLTSLHNFSDIEKGLREMRRVGKKTFVFSVLKKAKDFDAAEKLIKDSFVIKKIVDGKQDWIFFCVQ